MAKEPGYTDNGRRIIRLPGYEDAEGRLTCPDCGGRHFEIVNSYGWIFGKKRRRKCRNCGWVLTTREVIDEPDEMQ